MLLFILLITLLISNLLPFILALSATLLSTINPSFIAQGQISSLISNTTITKTDGTVTQLKDEYNSTKDTVDKHTTVIGKLETNVNDVTSKQAKLEQSLDGFKMTVSDTYATKEGLNQIKESIQNQDGYTIILSKECIVTTCD